MYSMIIIVLSIFSVFYLKNADCAVLYQCYAYFSGGWTHIISDNDRVTNNWCENQCKANAATYKYSGTISNHCYCRADKSDEWYNSLYYICHHTYSCPGNNMESCGGNYFRNDKSYRRITVSKIDRTTETVTEKNTKAPCATSVSTRDSAMTEFINMITSDTSSAIATKSTPYTTWELSSTTSQNANNDISSVLTEASTQATTEQTTEAVTVQNTQANSPTYISMRDTTTKHVNSMLNDETSPATVTHSTPDTVRKISSSTSENVNSVISTVMTEISTPARTEQTTDAVTVQNTQATSATYISMRDTTTTHVNSMLNDETSPAAVTQSTPGTVRKISSSTSENVNSVISTVMTEISTPARTVKRPKKLLCECPKKYCNTKWHFLDGSDITDSEVMKLVLEDFYQNILSEITIDKKSVTKEVRKKNSAFNNTKSAKFIGWGSIVFLILPMAIVIAIDLLNCCFHFQKRSRRSKHVKRNRINAISGDGDIPLQENVHLTEDYYASRSGNNFHPDEIKRDTYHKRRVDPC